MYDNGKIDNLLNEIRAENAAHQQFKKAYNKQIAFDFNLLAFFKPGENKITKILSFFLNPNDNETTHGQGDAFLSEFLELLKELKLLKETEYINKKIVKISTEHPISNGRRIDLLIKLDEKTIAIENKIGAADGVNQLKDYSEYLEKNTNGNFLLLYLNPYGDGPDSNSIKKEERATLEKEGKFKIISYEDEILKLIDRWIAVCEADKVDYFLKQLKQYLETKFFGKNALIMTDNIKQKIYDNPEEIDILIKAYFEINSEIEKKIDRIAKCNRLKNLELNEKGLTLKKGSPCTIKGCRILKYKIKKDGNEILWIRLGQKRELYTFYFYLSYNVRSDDELGKIIENMDNLYKNKEFEVNEDDDKIIDMFIDQVNKAIEAVKKYYHL